MTIFYFTSTGNSLAVAKRIGGNLISIPQIIDDREMHYKNVIWFDAIRYCNARGTREGLTPAYTISGETVTWNRNASDQRSAGYRLPTEAEWEYACRAGTTTPFNIGNNITELWIFNPSHNGRIIN